MEAKIRRDPMPETEMKHFDDVKFNQIIQILRIIPTGIILAAIILLCEIFFRFLGDLWKNLRICYQASFKKYFVSLNTPKRQSTRIKP